VSAIDLLDDEVDLTPSRHQRAAGAGDAGVELVRTREQLAAVVQDIPSLLPVLAVARGDGSGHTTTIAELARAGAVDVIGPVRAEPGNAGWIESDLPLLTAQQVVDGTEPAPSGDTPLNHRIVLMPGDVVVPVAGQRLATRVITDETAILGPNLYLLRPNPEVLDPWYLAGQVRTSGNHRQTSSTSGSFRRDLRRAQVRRLPMPEQRAHGATLRELVALEAAVRRAATLTTELVQLAADGVATAEVRAELTG